MAVRFVRLLLSTSALLILTSLSAVAAWNDRTLAQPLIETFGQSTIGRALDTWSLAQNPRRGTLWIGTSSELLSFDGERWRTQTLDTGTHIRALHIDENDVVWYGASGDLGYAVSEPDGTFTLHSLRERVPADEMQLHDVWGCARHDGVTDFVAKDKVLRWDGQNFRVWRFPTDMRLFPILFEGALWFQQLGVGLFRLDADGPKKIYDAGDIPDRGILGLFRAEAGLVSVSSHGLRVLGANSATIHSAATGAFLEKNIVATCTELPDGSLAIGTVHGGIGVVSRSGELLAVIDSRDGLPGNAIYATLLDAEGNFWTGAPGGVTRFPASSAVTIARFQEVAQARVTSLLQTETGVWATTDAHVYQITARRGARPIEPIAAIAGSYRALAAVHDGVLLGRHNGIDFLERSTVRPAASLAAIEIFGMTPASREPAVFTSEPYRLGRLSWNGAWTYQKLTDLSSTPNSVVEQPNHKLLIGSYRGRPQLLDLPSGALQPFPTSDHGDATTTASYVVGGSRRAHVVMGDRILPVSPDVAPQWSALRLPGRAEAVALSPAGDTLFVSFVRNFNGAMTVRGFATVALDEQGVPRAVQDLCVPGLERVGVINTLLATREEGADVVWVGGTEGLLRVRTDALAAWKPTQAPIIQILNSTSAASVSVPEGRPPEFDFGTHRFTLALGVREIAQRPGLRFQTRLGGPAAAWSAPSPNATLEFSNLFEGEYTFAARTVNSAGQTSEPTLLRFRILPPWYRSPWAYGSYAAAIALGAFGVMRYRERRSRERTRQLEALVRERTAELEKASAAKDEFLASVSHEIRNPMNGVVGLSAAIDVSTLDPEASRRFALLRHCAAHLSTLLEDILDFSRLQSGHEELQRQTFSPAELFEAVSAITAADRAAAGLPVQFALSPTVPRELIGDPRRLRQILLNLVGNALKYAGRGEIAVSAWSRPAEGGGHTVTFAVSDEGPGIPIDEQARIFEKFERGGSARVGRVPGAGMGLAVCHVLAEKMGGRLWLESAPGAGATFYFSVTLTVPNAAPASPIGAPSPHGASGTDPRAVLKWALIVDDEEYNCLALAAMLEQLGFRVQTEQHSLAVPTLVEAQAFDVIFLDYDMPGMSGPALARRLRELHHARGDQPILIATTAYTTAEKRAECLDAGMDGFLGKPISPQRIAQALEQALLQRGPAGAHYSTTDLPAVDHLANLRLVAERRNRALRDEVAVFIAECDEDLRQLDRAIATETTRAATSAAHRLAGRMSFVHARSASHLATKLEQCSAAYEWEQARVMFREFSAEWQRVAPTLTDRPSARAE